MIGSTAFLGFMLASAAQVQFAEVSRRHLPTDGYGEPAIASADIDGDGDQDLLHAVYVFPDFRVRLNLNDGRGRFAPAPYGDLTVAYVSSAAFGDIDGDGDADLVLGHLGSQEGGEKNAVLVNDGRGRFTDVSATHMPPEAERTRFVGFADFDGDGDLDLFCGNQPSYRGHMSFGGEDSVFRNDAGVFTAWWRSEHEDSTIGADFGDVDGDGDLDLVTTNIWCQGRLYLNDGTSFVDASARLPARPGGTGCVRLGDIDGDGDLDLFVGQQPPFKSRLYLNDGTGHFADATDARLPATAGSVQAALLADLDGDGDLDLALASPHGRNELWINKRGVFVDATPDRTPDRVDQSAAILAADVDGDGDLDLCIGNQGRHRLLLNDGHATFFDATDEPLPTASSSARVAVGDVDADGDPDLVWMPHYAAVHLHRNDGRGRFALGGLVLHEPNPSALALGDVDGDGDLDLVLGYDGPNALYLFDAHLTFSEAAGRLPIDQDLTSAVALGDVDGDGDLDLFLGNAQPNRPQNRLYLNDGRGWFTDVTASHLPIDQDRTAAIALADIDGDGDLDAVLANFGPNRLYLNDGRGRFANLPQFPAIPRSSVSVAVGDVDGDGDLDVVFGNITYLATTAQNQLYLNLSNAMFRDVTADRLPIDNDDTYAVAIGDVDEDGDLDLVFGNYGANQSRVHHNDGTGRFEDATARSLPADHPSTTVMQLADVDLDGDLDLLAAGSASPARLYANRLRQTFAPWLIKIGQPHTLEISANPGGALQGTHAVALLGARPARIAVPPFGVLGLDPASLAALPAVAIPAPTGELTLTIAVPDDRALIGARAFWQTVIVPPNGALRLTNAVADPIQ